MSFLHPESKRQTPNPPSWNPRQCPSVLSGSVAAGGHAGRDSRLFVRLVEVDARAPGPARTPTRTPGKAWPARPCTTPLLCDCEGLDLDAWDAHGWPPLVDFVNDVACLEMLLERDAKIDLADDDGRTVLHHAVALNAAAAIESLLRTAPSAPLAAVEDGVGNTPLLLASGRGSTEATVLLGLNDVNEVVGSGGRATMHHAAALGDPETLRAIPEHGSFQKGMKTGDGRSTEVAMLAGIWTGEVKAVLRRYNNPA